MERDAAKTSEVRSDVGLLLDTCAEMARTLFSVSSLGATLQAVVDLGVGSVEGCDAAGIFLVQGDIATHPVVTSPIVLTLDALHRKFGEGPCLDAVEGRSPAYAEDLASDARWPDFGPLAAAEGMRSLLALTIFDHEILGALNLYAHLPRAFGALDRATGLLLAWLAGLAIRLASEREDERRRLEHLEAALVTREVIGQAQGVLMERERISSHEAFELLRRASQQLNVKLREVALRLIETGEDPVPTSSAGASPNASPLQALNGPPPPPAVPMPELTGVAELLAVVAHPDDESFGLGGLLHHLVQTGRQVRVLCLTHGEASTLGAASDLGAERADELAAATIELGIARTVLDDWPDGQLDATDRAELIERVESALGRADAIVVFEPSGVTGHADHQVASRLGAEVAARNGLVLLEWGIPSQVASVLRAEFSVPFGSLDERDPAVFAMPVDRERQWAAIRCHVSQNPDAPLLARRLQLTGEREWVRVRSAEPPQRLAAFVRRVGPLARPGATAEQRRELLDRLVGFAAFGLPAELTTPDALDGYAVHCLHDDPTGWTLAAVVTSAGGATPPHDHASWGAAATAIGLERNTRYLGTCPDQLDARAEQLAPVGGGYLFEAGDIHQASDASGSRTVSLHLLVGGGPEAQQRCHEPPRHRA